MPQSENIPAILADLRENEKTFKGQLTDANFILYDAFVEAYPKDDAKYDLTPARLLQNEVKYLKELYVSEPFPAAIARAKAHGLNEMDMAGLMELYEEVKAFEAVDPQSQASVEAFLTKYPNSPLGDDLRYPVFLRLARAYYQRPDPAKIGSLVRLVPAALSKGFYSKTWTSLMAQMPGKPPQQQFDLLLPWLNHNQWRFQNVSEEVFLVDLLNCSALILQDENPMASGLLNMTGAPVAHLMFTTIITTKEDLTDADVNIFNLGGTMRKMARRSSNVSSSREIMDILGSATVVSGALGLVKEVSKIQATKEAEQKGLSTELLRKKMADWAKQGGQLKTMCQQLVLKILENDPDNWPSLGLLTLLPDKNALEPIILMPRFYDYQQDLVVFVKRFADDYQALALAWLADPKAGKAKWSRALFILGCLKKKAASDKTVSKLELGDQSAFRDYYLVRLGKSDGSKALIRLQDAAAHNDMVALVLYNSVSGDKPTPADLKQMLEVQIKTERTDVGGATHVFLPLLKNMSPADQARFVDLMFKSSLDEWQKIARYLYGASLPKGEIAQKTIDEVFAGGNPYKKAELVCVLAQRKQKKAAPQVERFLRGALFTPEDMKVFHKNSEALFKRNVPLFMGSEYNKQNAINEMADNLKVFAVGQAAPGLDLLPYSTARDLVVTKFLTNEFLVLGGTQWLVSNYPQHKAEGLVLPPINSYDKSVKKACLAFLQAYSSPTPNYGAYVKNIREMGSDSGWLGVVIMGMSSSDDALLALSSGLSKPQNPLPDPILDVMLRNVQTRMVASMAKSKQMQTTPAPAQTKANQAK